MLPSSDLFTVDCFPMVELVELVELAEMAALAELTEFKKLGIHYSTAVKIDK
jgi:hypothetical protein